jgi:glucose-6-phosphate 1-dehydrogenase
MYTPGCQLLPDTLLGIWSLQGDKRLFIRADELEAAWNLYTPLLHALEKNKVGSGAVPQAAPGGITSSEELCPTPLHYPRIHA